MSFALDYAKGTTACAVDRAMALSFLGHRGQEMSSELEQRLEQMAVRCERENLPRFMWRTFDVERPADSQTSRCVRLAGCALELSGKDIYAHLEGAERVALLVVTLGSAWQRTFEELGVGRPTDALLYDACASAATETAANASHELLAQAARAVGLEARARFSPGYGDLPLDVQPAFLDTLDAQRALGVFATESNLLAPVKSITAVVGLFEPGAQIADGDGRDAQCAACAAHAYCNFRAGGTTCHG